MDSREATMKHVGGWCIVFGVAAIAVGCAVGVGCLVSGGRLLSRAREK